VALACHVCASVMGLSVDYTSVRKADMFVGGPVEVEALCLSSTSGPLVDG
jgi:hypothetical protein